MNNKIVRARIDEAFGHDFSQSLSKHLGNYE